MNKLLSIMREAAWAYLDIGTGFDSQEGNSEVRFLVLPIFLFLVGCASQEVSIYNQGCRDGIRRYDKSKAFPAEHPDYVDLFCDSLDYEYRAKQLQKERPESGGRK
jgi:hypothetical protein